MSSIERNGSISAPACQPPTLQFSTDMFPERERIAAWRDFFGRGIIKVDIEPMGGEFRSNATLRALPGLGIITGSLVGMRFERPEHLIDDDTVGFSIVLAGESRFSACGRETVVGTGDAIMMGAGEGGFNEAPGHCRFLTMRMSAAALSSTVRHPGDLVCRRIPAQTPALQLLTHYVGILDNEQALATPELRHQIVTHIQDLVALTLGAARDTAEIAEGCGVRAARLRAIKEDIVNSLRDGEVSVAAVAAKHRVSSRYLQLLFEEDGTTFTDFVLAQRLARAHRMLSDPRYAKQRIAVLAYDVGFNDPSYFVRCFRRQYGVAPSEVRRAQSWKPATLQ